MTSEQRSQFYLCVQRVLVAHRFDCKLKTFFLKPDMELTPGFPGRIRISFFGFVSTDPPYETILVIRRPTFTHSRMKRAMIFLQFLFCSLGNINKLNHQTQTESLMPFDL